MRAKERQTPDSILIFISTTCSFEDRSTSHQARLFRLYYEAENGHDWMLVRRADRDWCNGKATAESMLQLGFAKAMFPRVMSSCLGVIMPWEAHGDASNDNGGGGDGSAEVRGSAEKSRLAVEEMASGWL